MESLATLVAKQKTAEIDKAKTAFFEVDRLTNEPSPELGFFMGLGAGVWKTLLHPRYIRTKEKSLLSFQ